MKSLRRFFNFGKIFCAVNVCAVLICFQVSLQSVAASTFSMIEKGHEEICGCGPKCRKDRCCCKPESTEKNAQPVDQAKQKGRGDEKSAGIKPDCLMSAPCGEMPDAPESPRNRSYSPKQVALINFPLNLPEIQYNFWDNHNIFYSFESVSGLDRPPRI